MHNSTLKLKIVYLFQFVLTYATTIKASDKFKKHLRCFKTKQESD